MTLTAETLYGLERAAQAALIDPFPSGQAPEIQLPAAWVVALVAEVRRYRGLADDDTALLAALRGRQTEMLRQEGFVDLWGKGALEDYDESHQDLMRAALRAALGQEDA